ncbi:MAG: diguanylate cyclase [Thermodesulfobacteriota bacterium]
MEQSDTVKRLQVELAQVKESNARLTETLRTLEKANHAVLLLNKKLNNLALKDSHTGLYNRRYLKETLEKELSLAKRHAQSVSVLMMDIDYFKSVNDAYGHTFGDLVLKQFSKTLKRVIRRYDILFRFGGEEFVIISPRTDRQTSFVLAERLLRTVRARSFGSETRAVNLKLSISVASYPEDGLLIRGIDLVRLADQILNKVKEYGGNKVYSSEDVKRIEGSLSLENEVSLDMELLMKKIDRLSQRANQSLVEGIFAVAKTIGLKDRYPDTAAKSTMNYAAEIAKMLNLPKSEIEHIRKAAMLHDIGKAGISEAILLKKSKLTPREFETIKKHPQLGTNIIRPLHFLRGTIPFILHHHERWDGKGYPDGLKGKEIPLGARIISVVDAYRSLTANRPYRRAYSKTSLMKILKRESGTKFDPQVVAAFLKILGSPH